MVAVEIRRNASRVSSFTTVLPVQFPRGDLCPTADEARNFLSKLATTHYTAVMAGYLIPLLVLALILTLGVLLFGILTMARGGDFNKRYGNKLMRARVILQGIALLLLLVVMLLSGKS